MLVSTASLQQSQQERRLILENVCDLRWQKLTPSPLDPQVIQQDREAYTSNKQKQIVTPLLNDDNAYPADAVHLTEVPDPRLSSHAYTDKQKSEKKDFAAYMKAHNINPISREASKEVLRAMAERKKKIGPGIDRGGCTLINEEMRRLFIQNPGIRRVVALSE